MSVTLPTNGVRRTVAGTARGVHGMRASEDAGLVTAARAGDAEAYGLLFERYESRIYNFAYGILGNSEDARDVTQDAFIRVFEALPRKQDIDFSAYLYRTARNAAYDVTRGRGRFDGAEPDLDSLPESSMYADPVRSALFAEQAETVRGAMASLSEDHRAVLMLREVQELSYQEIADALGMTRTNVGVTIMRARLKFKGAFRMSHVDVDSLCAECQAMLPLLSAYLDDELGPEQRAKVDAHLDGCPLCRYALDEMREASKSYRCFIPLIPPEGMRAEVLWRVTSPGSRVDLGGGEGSRTSGGTGEGLDAPADLPVEAGETGPTKHGPSTGARVTIVLAVLAALGVALIVTGLAAWPHPEPASVLTWGSWRGSSRPYIHVPSVTAPGDALAEEDAGRSSGSAGTGDAGGDADGGASAPAAGPTMPNLRFFIPPKLRVATPTVPPLY